jgi:hypothetical protein
MYVYWFICASVEWKISQGPASNEVSTAAVALRSVEERKNYFVTRLT